MKFAPLASTLPLLVGCGADAEDAPATADAEVLLAADAVIEGPPACTGLLPSYDLTKAVFTGYARPRDAGDATSPTVYGLTVFLDEGPPIDLFEIQLWSNFGAFESGVTPGTIPIEGAETSLNDCGLCALVFGDMTANGSTSMLLVAQSGAITLDAVSLEAGAVLRGSAPELHYRQVNSSGTIPDGCGLTIRNINFDVTLDAP
ncbi:MAG: hypothetical protein GY811_14720 [Myxococcales bacterium]|nr:hypothetical protein [Myxococcales bacterium]